MCLNSSDPACRPVNIEALAIVNFEIRGLVGPFGPNTSSALFCNSVFKAIPSYQMLSN
jgi:hypothetical protein